ncbi:hypothetical protein WN55_10344 [Dufourea novaeangliae]|uniref:Uncharacterized protein n=1 Tax=Dufourea novaeangliae TaxID=178035 RepID=A0A154P532_DUFNO|nr:hypothetical protein WN55_10344 [Dufourea novaeangliae]
MKHAAMRMKPVTALKTSVASCRVHFCHSLFTLSVQLRPRTGITVRCFVFVLEFPSRQWECSDRRRFRDNLSG